MSRRTPEDKALWQRFDVIQDCRTCSSISGNTFKPSIYDCEFTTPEHIWKHTEDKGQHPGQDNGHITVLQGQSRHLPDKNERECSDKECDDETDSQWAESGIHSINERDTDRQSHKQGTDKQCLTYIDRYCLDIDHTSWDV